MPSDSPLLLLWLDDAEQIENTLMSLLPAGTVRCVRCAAKERPSQDVLSQVEILFGWDAPPGALGDMPALSWVQAATAGVERWITRDDLAPAVILTSARGIHRVQMPDNIIGVIFHVTKDFDRCKEQQARHEWKPFFFDLVAGKTLGIIGLGAIGSELARKAAALEMKVIGVRRTPVATPFVEAVFPLDDIGAVLTQSDFVVLLLPATPETDGLMNARRLDMMKPGAWLLNFARGEHVVDADLVDAVGRGKLGGAVLDAFREEPLPADHPFWSTPKIHVIPHMGGRDPEKNKVFGKIIADNVKRYIAGQPMAGAIDRKIGY